MFSGVLYFLRNATAASLSNISLKGAYSRKYRNLCTAQLTARISPL